MRSSQELLGLSEETTWGDGLSLTQTPPDSPKRRSLKLEVKTGRATHLHTGTHNCIHAYTHTAHVYTYMCTHAYTYMNTFAQLMNIQLMYI